MSNELYEKVMGLLDVAVDMGTTMPQEVVDKMQGLYNNSDNWRENDYFYMKGIINSLFVIYTAKSDNSEKLEQMSNMCCDYGSERWDDVTSQEYEEELIVK